MKIGILTHFASFQPSYALSVGWNERARLLDHFEQDFDFLVNITCPEDLYPHQVNCLPRIKTSEPFKKRANFFTDAYKEILEPYDAILTADILYQIKANHLAYNQAVRWASPYLKAKWYHWIHSAWMVRQNPLPPYPERLRWILPEPESNHKIIYLNSWELNHVAKMYNTSPQNVYSVYNPKDPRTFFDFSSIACKIVKILDLPNKDVVQIFPHCSSRMDSKGIDAVIKVFGSLKRQGLNVAIIFANANYRSVQPEIEVKKGMMEKVYNLKEFEDFLFTGDITDKYKPLPTKDVSDLFRISNLFVFGSWRETVGNVFQEAKISGNLLVLNENLPCLMEMGGTGAIYVDFTHKNPGRRDGYTGDTVIKSYLPSEEEYFDEVAKIIIQRLSVNPPLIEKWKFSWEWIWHNQFKLLLYGEDSEKVSDTLISD
jgi:glycosyltransferase involved in cell wall biosynthesis